MSENLSIRKLEINHHIPKIRFSSKACKELYRRAQEKYGKGTKIPIDQVIQENPDWVDELSFKGDERHGSPRDVDNFEVHAVTRRTVVSLTKKVGNSGVVDEVSA